MMELKKGDYSRSPEVILIDRESASCRGCRGEYTANIGGALYTVCVKKRPDGKRRPYGRKCDAFEEKGT